MTFCVTPGCLAAQNPDSARYCLSCGAKLLLKERYRALQPIGSGGFGRTFLAVDEHIPSKPLCVIKQLYIQSPGSLVARKAAELFRKEAVRLDQLGKHPQIPTLLAHFEQNRQLYLVQELINGETLKQELENKGAYNEMQICELLHDLLPVLQYIHTHKVIHRDIKPSNIMRRPLLQSETGGLVLIDFGVAKLFSDSALLQTGTITGSPEYMAPEQIKGKAFPASDLYSLGVTCIHLLTKVPPLDMFDALNDRWVWRDFLPPGKQVSDRLGKILDKLLQNSLKNRFQCANEVRQALNLIPKASHPPKQWTSCQNLVSEVGIDYTQLQDLLSCNKWKEADQQTGIILCQALGKSWGYYLTSGDIEKLPCEDLWIIDKLWVKYSNGRFGFSIQKHIYEDVGEDYLCFCDRVGWPLHNPSNLDSVLKFHLKAPMGHLPSRRWIGGYSWWRHTSVLATKLEECNIT